jgi:hypothetical protein
MAGNTGDTGVKLAGRGGPAPAEEVLSFLGVKSCRIVWIEYDVRLQASPRPEDADRAEIGAEGGALSLVEYREGRAEPQRVEVADSRAFAPLFSPDGTRAVFSRKSEPSDIFVMTVGRSEPLRVAFGAGPHWWVDPETGDHCIVYRDVSAPYRTLPAGRTFRQRLGEDNRPAGEPEGICPYGFGGGITPDGRYLVTGLRQFYFADLKTGRYLMPLGDVRRAPGVSCVSVSPDNTHRAMSLRFPRIDFGICGPTGRWDLRIRCPKEVEEWQTPQWSTHPNFATASGLNPDKTYDLYIVRLSDYEKLRVTTGGDCLHAHMWVGPEPDKEAVDKQEG